MKGRFRQLRAKAQAVNSIAVKEDLFNFSFFRGRLFCHGFARGARNEETRITTNRGFNGRRTEEIQEHMGRTLTSA